MMASRNAGRRREVAERNGPVVAAPKEKKDAPALTDLLKLIFDRVDPFLKIVTTIAGRRLRAQESESHFRTHMAWVAAAIVLIIVGVAGLLTYMGKLEGSTFGFLLGLIVGYVLTFVRDAIRGPAEGE